MVIRGQPGPREAPCSVSNPVEYLKPSLGGGCSPSQSVRKTQTVEAKALRGNKTESHACTFIEYRKRIRFNLRAFDLCIAGRKTIRPNPTLLLEKQTNSDDVIISSEVSVTVPRCASRPARVGSFLLFEKIEWSADVDNVVSR